jgi:imidazole glycerol-phosphate synthase subunit HisH
VSFTAVIDYGSGNLRSVLNALKAVRPETEARIVSRPEDLEAAGRIILPGVGAFADCMAGLRNRPGLLDTLRLQVLETQKPFLGICVGMQLLADRGEEDGQHAGLGWIPGCVTRLCPASSAMKVPHMGWNTLDVHQTHPLLEGLKPQAHAYFVHSYAFRPSRPGHCAASTDHGERIAAVVTLRNLAGVQFHPEKSQHTGLVLLRNFLNWQP